MKKKKEKENAIAVEYTRLLRNFECNTKECVEERREASAVVAAMTAAVAASTPTAQMKSRACTLKIMSRVPCDNDTNAFETVM